jgi:hypothetical protein
LDQAIFASGRQVEFFGIQIEKISLLYRVIGCAQTTTLINASARKKETKVSWYVLACLLFLAPKRHATYTNPTIAPRM